MDEHRITPREFAENFETYHAAAARGEAVAIVSDSGSGGQLVYRSTPPTPPAKTPEERHAALAEIMAEARKLNRHGATALDHGDILYDEFGLPK